jgi:hypothetical protein
MGFFAIMRPRVQPLIESNRGTEFDSPTVVDLDPSEMLFEISRTDEGFWWQISAVLSTAGLTMGRRRSYDCLQRLWVVRVTSQTNLRKRTKELVRFIRHRFQYTGVRIERGTLNVSLEGRRGLVIFILAEDSE